MEDQENSMDFKSLRAMFQEKENFLKTKPALPDKPKVVPPPQSPTYLPAGAHPSLLTSINQALESKTLNAPRVVFKDEKESKRHQTNSKGKEKPDKKVKEGKDKAAKESKEKLPEDSSDPEEKKLPALVTQKESTAGQVPVSLPPKATTQKKKVFSPFKKATKRESADNTRVADSGPAPLMPVGYEDGNLPMEPLYSIPKARPLSKTTLPDPSGAVTVTPPSHTPEPPNSSPPPTIIPDIPVLRGPTPQSETPAEVKNPALPLSNPASNIEIVSNPVSVAPAPSSITAPDPPTITAPAPPSTAAPKRPTITAPAPPSTAAPKHPTITAPAPPSTAAPAPPSTAATAAPAPPSTAAPTPPLTNSPKPPPKLALSEPSLVVSAQSQTPSRSSSPTPSPSPSPRELQGTADSDPEDVNIASLENPPSPATKSPSTPQLAKAERPISALSALERAGDMSTGKKTPPGDRRIFSALEKARKKTNSPSLTPNRSFSVTPPPEELLLQENHTSPLPDLPPVDYEGGNPASQKPAQLNGTDSQEETSSIWEIISREESDSVQAMMAAPSSQSIPDLESLDLDPDKPDRNSVNLNEFIPPLFDAVIPVPPEFSEAEAAEVPEFEESLVLEDNSPVISMSEEANKDSNDADVPHGQNPLGINNNGINDPETEVQSEPVYEDDYEESPQPTLPVHQDPPPKQEPQPDYRSSYYEETHNTYECIKTPPSKKKGKHNSGKKSKGTLKNPYVESTQTQETIRERIKSSRFGKSEKKTSAEVPDEKELKKKEKQRMEKEKKELKEKQERERKEQKEKEKKENEMKKKFKITGQEEVMYQAKVIVTPKGRKHNLPVKSGDVISIIRTTNCPKGKWLAKDNSNNYGYVSVKDVDLDIKEMLKLGKQGARNSTIMEPEDNGTGNRASNHFHHSADSFTDDSDEWTCDDDNDHIFPAHETSDQVFGGHTRTLSMPDVGERDLSINHQYSYSDMCDSSQSQPKALQKLATFLQAPKPVDPTPGGLKPETSPAPEQEEAVSEPEDDSTQEAEFDPTAILLPPPDQYADNTV